MTREDFILSVNSWEELLRVCYELDSDVCSDIYTARDRDDYIYDTIHENDDEWFDLRDLFNEIPTGNDYYEKGEGYLEWFGVDDEFGEFKQRALQDGDDREVWDMPIVNDTEDDDDTPIEAEDFTPLELLNCCNNKFVGIMDDIAKKREEIMNEELEFRRPSVEF